MRSIRKTMLLGLAAALAVALASPAMASANWTKEGKSLSATPPLQWASGGIPLDEAEPISLNGPLQFESEEWGGIECVMTLDGTVGTGPAGSISKVSATNCVIDPILKIYGCTGVGSVTANELSWPMVAAHSGGKKAIYLGISLSYKLTGGIFCPKDIMIQDLVVTKPAQVDAISSLTFSDTVATTVKLGKSTYNVDSSMTATLAVTPGTYGLLTTNLVELSGTLGRASELGELKCSVDGTLALEAGSEGRVTALDFSSCYQTEFPSCTIKSVTANGLPLNVIDEGSKIRIPKFSVTIQRSGSGCGSETVSGTLFATPDNASAITSTSLSGTLTGGLGNQTWTGSVSWDPAGVYGL